MMRGNPAYRTALVVGAEAYSRILNWEDRTTCVIFGDGAGAAVLRPVDAGFGVLSSYLRADGSKHETICVPGGGSRLPASPEVLAKRLDKPSLAVDRDGNASAASVPITLDEAARAGRLRRGDVVVLVAFGGGHT